MVDFKKTKNKTYVTQKEGKKEDDKLVLDGQDLGSNEFLIIYQSIIKDFAVTFRQMLSLSPKLVEAVKRNWFVFLDFIQESHVFLSLIISKTEVNLLKKIINNINISMKPKAEPVTKGFDYGYLFDRKKSVEADNKRQIVLKDREFNVRAKRPTIKQKKRKTIVKKLEKVRKNSIHHSTIDKRNVLLRLESVPSSSKDKFLKMFFDLVSQDNILNFVNLEYMIKFLCKKLYTLDQMSHLSFSNYLLKKICTLMRVNENDLKNILTVTKASFMIYIFIYYLLAYRYGKAFTFREIKAHLDANSPMNDEQADDLLRSCIQNLDSLIQHKESFDISNVNLKLDLDFILSITMLACIEVGHPVLVHDFQAVFQNKLFKESTIKYTFFSSYENPEVKSIIENLPNGQKINKYNSINISINPILNNNFKNNQQSIIRMYIWRFLDLLEIESRMVKFVEKYIEGLDFKKFDESVLAFVGENALFDVIFLKVSCSLTFLIHNLLHVAQFYAGRPQPDIYELQLRMYKFLIDVKNKWTHDIFYNKEKTSYKINVDFIDGEKIKSLGLRQVDTILRKSQIQHSRKNTLRSRRNSIDMRHYKLENVPTIRQYLSMINASSVEVVCRDYPLFMLVFDILAKTYLLKTNLSQYYKVS